MSFHYSLPQVGILLSEEHVGKQIIRVGPFEFGDYSYVPSTVKEWENLSRRTSEIAPTIILKGLTEDSVQVLFGREVTSYKNDKKWALLETASSYIQENMGKLESLLRKAPLIDYGLW